MMYDYVTTHTALRENLQRIGISSSNILSAFNALPGGLVVHDPSKEPIYAYLEYKKKSLVFDGVDDLINYPINFGFGRADVTKTIIATVRYLDDRVYIFASYRNHAGACNAATFSLRSSSIAYETTTLSDSPYSQLIEKDFTPKYGEVYTCVLSANGPENSYIIACNGEVSTFNLSVVDTGNYNDVNTIGWFHNYTYSDYYSKFDLLDHIVLDTSINSMQAQELSMGGLFDKKTPVSFFGEQSPQTTVQPLVFIVT